MRSLWVFLAVLVLAVSVASGCSNCPIHKALFGSDEEEVAAEAEAGTEEAAAPETSAAP